MPRLNAEEWEMIRAKYEVQGSTVSALAKEFGINHAGIIRRAKTEGWRQGEYHKVTEEKINAVKELVRVEDEKSQLPNKHQYLIDRIAQKELEAQDIGADLKAAILSKSRDMLAKVTEPHHVLTLAKTHSELLKQPTPQNQIAVVNGGGGNDNNKQDGPKLELVLNPPPDGRRK